LAEEWRYDGKCEADGEKRRSQRFNLPAFADRMVEVAPPAHRPSACLQGCVWLRRGTLEP